MTRFARYKKTYLEADGFKGRGASSNQPKLDHQAKRSDIRREKRKYDRNSKMVCFNCRKPGHSVKDCPTNSTANPNLDTELDTVELATGICYHCGTMEHSSKNCDHINRKKHPFKFATCFLCREDGHLASKCKNNINGLYPNGGGCKHCDSKDHFAKDCEMEKKDEDVAEVGVMDLNLGADDDDVFLEMYKKQANKRSKIPEKKVVKKKAKVVNF